MPLEPLSALALFCNVLELAGKGVQAVKFAKDTYSAADGLAKDHHNLLDFATQIEAIVTGIRDSLETVDVLQTADGEILKVVATCQDLITRYKSLLERCRAQKRASKGASAKATIRSVFAKGELDSLHQSLEVQGTILRTTLAFSARENLGVLVQQSYNAEIDQKHIKDSLGSVQIQLRRLEAKLLDPDDLVAKLREANKVSSFAYLQLDINFILTGLQSSSTGSTSSIARYNDVFDAAPETCGWIFQSHEDLLRTCPTLKVSLGDWMKEGQGIFHIAGKPGAGKSTLLKYLYKSPTTKKLLHIWSGKDDLVLAKYFFWKFDSYQNRLNGLKRSILYEVLQKAEITKELILLLFQNQIGQGASSLEREQQLAIDNDDVELAFSNLISTKTGLTGRKFCFFLDALDEFDQETAREDYVDLVLLIQQWVEESDDHVKIVVSSREFPEFQAFDEGQRIRIQLFTLGDMRTIVRDRLQSHPHFKRLKWLNDNANEVPPLQNTDDAARHLKTAESFVDYVAIAAEGVFLWSVLMVKELRKGLSRGDSIRKLYSKVAAASRDLKKFFQSIIETIDDAYQREAIILFSVVLRLSRNRSAGLGLMECSFFLKAADANVIDPAQWQPDMEEYSLDERQDLAEIQITGRFNGLLEISPSNTSVKFLHSSIMEVMAHYTSQGLKKHNLTDAQIDTWLCWIILTWVKWALKRAALVDGVIDFDMLAANIKGLLSGLPRGTLDDQTMEVLDKIDTTLLLTWQKSPWQNLDEWSTAQPCRRSGFIKLNSMTVEVYSLLLGAAELGRADYLYWKLNEMGAKNREGAFASLLLHYLCAFSFKPAILQGVLAKGVSVNCMIDSTEAPSWFFSRRHYVWHEFLANILGPPLKSPRYKPHEYCHLWEMAEIWLRNGADSRFWIGLGLDRVEAYQSTEGRIVRFAYLYELGGVHTDTQAGLFPRKNTMAGIRELIAFVSPHNRDTLLEVLARRSRSAQTAT